MLMRRKAVTIRDVAQLAQVSISTVSQVLNGNTQYVVEAKRDRVLSAVRELQYRPNAIARSMVKRQTATVGVVFTTVLGNLFVPIVEHLQDVLRPQGYNIILASSPDTESESQAIEALKAQQVDGFIFMSFRSATSQHNTAHLLRLKEEGIPLVVINRSLERECDLNQIQFNHWETGYLATKHLINLGHTSIATISGPLHDVPPWQSAVERQQGWLQALKEHDLGVVAEGICDGHYTYQGGYDAGSTESILLPWCTGTSGCRPGFSGGSCVCGAYVPRTDHFRSSAEGSRPSCRTHLARSTICSQRCTNAEGHAQLSTACTRVLWNQSRTPKGSILVPGAL